MSWWLLLLLDTDLPYLEPLLFHLRKDETLKNYFTEKSFFMPKDDLISAVEEAIKNDCPAPRALWVLPQDGLAINSNNTNCKPSISHTFNIMLMIACIRDSFQIVKKDNVVHLSGEYLEMTAIRKAIMKSVSEFNKLKNKEFTGRTFENIRFMKYQSLYPDDSFLVNNLEYNVTIL